MSMHEEEVLGKAYDARLMRRLLTYVRPYKLMLGGAVGLVVLSSVLQLIGPLATAAVLDLLVEPTAAGAPLSAPSLWVGEWLEQQGWDASAGVALVASVYLGSLALTFVVLYLQGYIMQLMGQYVLRDLRAEVFSHLQPRSDSRFSVADSVYQRSCDEARDQQVPLHHLPPLPDARGYRCC